jgi:hypothetical protein
VVSLPLDRPDDLVGKPEPDNEPQPEPEAEPGLKGARPTLLPSPEPGGHGLLPLDHHQDNALGLLIGHLQEQPPHGRQIILPAGSRALA